MAGMEFREDERMRDRALFSLARAFRSGRMVAITGAMSTQSLDYYSWKKFAEKAGLAAGMIASKYRTLCGGSLKDQQRELLNRVAWEAERLGGIATGTTDNPSRYHTYPMNDAVAFWLLREGFRKLELPLDAKIDLSGCEGAVPESACTTHNTASAAFEAALAGLFNSKSKGPFRGAMSAVEALARNVGIRRFATLNYDLELERELMLFPSEREPEVDLGLEIDPYEAIGDGPGSRLRKDSIKRLHRVLDDGTVVESDIAWRERIDRVFEFAIGSTDVDRHILHLHGRVDEPETMVVDIGDYDNLYRREDVFRSPFEHGLRALFAGNPVLFAGIGMSEAELNEKLQYFVANQPYRRVDQTFVLWGTIDKPEPFRGGRRPGGVTEDKCRLFMRTMRADYHRRLGVHVIFDEDLVDAEGAWLKRENDPAEVSAGPEAGLTTGELRARFHKTKSAKTKEALKLDGLKMTIEALPLTVGYLEAFSKRSGDTYRSVESRMRVPPPKGLEDEPVRLWGTPRMLEAASKVGLVPVGKSASDRYHAMMLGSASVGWGRGLLAEKVAREPRIPRLSDGWLFHPSKLNDRILINAGFSYDADSMLTALVAFLRHRCRVGYQALAALSREECIVRREIFDVKRPTLIIFNGIERFFGHDGRPLSAELDQLLRCAQTEGNKASNLQWLFLSTGRVQSYFRMIGADKGVLRDDLITPLKPESLTAEELGWKIVDSSYMNHVRQNYKKVESAKSKPGKLVQISDGAIARIRHAEDAGRDPLRRAFFAAFLDPAYLRKLEVGCPLRFKILRTMAFIGTPIEAEVLLHAPGVAGQLPPDVAAAEQKLSEEMKDLSDLGLVLPIGVDKEDVRPARALRMRYGLHRSVITEFRERHGAPMSEAKLSTTFNMSLFLAQPEDRHTPERRFHEELNALVDGLITAWETMPAAANTLVDRAAFEAAASATLDSESGDEEEQQRKEGRQKALRSGWKLMPNASKATQYNAFEQLSQRRSAACLRAALGVLRGYYSTSNLLTLEGSEGRFPAATHGALTDHANRLDRLLRNFGRISTARMIYRAIREGDGPVSDQRRRQISEELGPEPLYRDDLVWLHNERGVLKLVQGELYAADRSLTLALEVNADVEGSHRGHNWRRISINRIGLHMERGAIRMATRRIIEIEESIDNAMWLRKPPKKSRVTQIRNKFGKDDDTIVSCDCPDFTREEILAVGLTTAYRGLIEHMRGGFRDAMAHYRCGIAILRRLGEARAYAHFQRHYASLGALLGSRAERHHQIRLSVAAAQSAQQADIAHRAQIMGALTVRSDRGANSEQRREALQQLRDALEYASVTDCYRVRIEASSALAREMRRGGDYETALRYASDALAIACRYGHVLHKIHLRIEIGQILMSRGDPKSGRALLDRAAKEATRTGFLLAMETIAKARTLEVGGPTVTFTREEVARPF